MRKLLIPLLAAIALPTAVMAETWFGDWLAGTSQQVNAIKKRVWKLSSMSCFL